MRKTAFAIILFLLAAIFICFAEGIKAMRNSAPENTVSSYEQVHQNEEKKSIFNKSILDNIIKHEKAGGKSRQEDAGSKNANINSEKSRIVVIQNTGDIGHAIDKGDIEALKILLKEDNVNVRDVLVRDYGYNYDLLAYALSVKNPKPEIIRLLIKEGADVNVTTGNNGMTPLHLISQRSDIGEPYEIVKILLDAGADPNKPDAQNRYAIVQTVIKGHPESMRLMIKAGADINVENSQGYSLMKIAAMQKVRTEKPEYDRIIAVLKAAGAK